MPASQSTMTMLVFSKDRPLQLDAALASFKRHCRDASSIAIKALCKASTSRMGSLYRRLMREHPDVDFIQETDFRRDLLVSLRDREFVLFVVDDSVFVRDFAMRDMAAALRRFPEAIGFSLRLGKNTNYCYTLDKAQKIPAFEKIDGGLKFRWPEAESDFNYPLEVSSSVYRVADVLPLLESIQFKNPNTLENEIAARAVNYRQSHPVLLCPEQTQAFSIPANMTQSVCDNRIADRPDYSVEALEKLYARGERIDTAAMDAVVPNGAHYEVSWAFLKNAAPVPRVSVVIPCYNQAQYLAEAVNSVVEQTFVDWELIIVNDGSTDDSLATANKLAAQHKDRRIHIIDKRNGGLSMARNEGIRHAEGGYILPLDADDRLAPEMLAKTVAVLEAQPKMAIVYTNVTFFGTESKTIEAADYEFEKIKKDNQLNYCALFRREAWAAAGGYNANMIWGYEDWDFWVSCGERGFAAKRIPEPLFFYRRKAESMFTGAVARDAHLRARVQLNHPALYDAKTLAAAQKLWSDPALPPPPGAPKVSVIIPTYNRPIRLEETIRSVLAQTMQDFEIIVVNDNGVDVTCLAQGLDPKGRIYPHRHAANRGLAAARNTGLRFARGKYIAFLDDDDIFLPDHLQTLVDALESGGKRAAYSDACCAEEKTENGRHVVVKRTVPFSEDWVDDKIFVHNIAPVQCFVFERGAALAAGPLDETLTTHEDWDFWIRLGLVATPEHIRKVTTEFRSRSDGSSMTSSRRPDFVRTAKIIYDKYRGQTARNDTLRGRQKKYLRGLERNVNPASRSWFKRLQRRLRPAAEETPAS